MKYITLIQDSLDYIEANLKAELTPNELASNLGFSLYHYSRIFQSAVGRSVKDYIIKRRLTHAIYEISLGGKMIDVSMSYGFDTYAGFYKAFKKEYGLSPKKYILSDSFHEIDITGRKHWSDIFQSIIAGYDSVAHLSEDEIKAIPYVIFSIQLIFIAYCEGFDKLKELSITNQKMLRWLLENKEILEYKRK